MSERPTPETDAFAKAMYSRGVDCHHDGREALKHAERLERELAEARKERNQLKSLNESYAACWDEIKDVLNESEQGDKTCDLDRVLKAIRERNEAREENKKLREALLRVRTWGISSKNFSATDSCKMSQWIDDGCVGELPKPDGPWIYEQMEETK